MNHTVKDGFLLIQRARYYWNPIILTIIIYYQWSIILLLLLVLVPLQLIISMTLTIRSNQFDELSRTQLDLIIFKCLCRLKIYFINFFFIVFVMRTVINFWFNNALDIVVIIIHYYSAVINSSFRCMSNCTRNQKELNYYTIGKI